MPMYQRSALRKHFARTKPASSWFRLNLPNSCGQKNRKFCPPHISAGLGNLNAITVQERTTAGKPENRQHPIGPGESAAGGSRQALNVALLW